MNNAGGKPKICLVKDLDEYNFKTMPVGTLLGHRTPESHACILVKDADGTDHTQEYIYTENDEVRLKRPAFPA